MKIEISIGEVYTHRIPDGEDDNGNIWYVEDEDVWYEHDSYCDSIDEAIERLLELKRKEEKIAQPRCDKCVHLPIYCGHDDKNGNCSHYKRDPPDGGYYG